MSAVQSSLLTPGLYAYSKQGTILAGRALCELLRYTYQRLGLAKRASQVCNMAKVDSKEPRSLQEVPGDQGPGGAESQDQVTANACRDNGRSKKRRGARKGEPDGETSYDFRRLPRTPSDVSSSVLRDAGDTGSGSRSRHTPSVKKESIQSRRITEYFQVSNKTRFKDDCEEENRNPASSFLESALLDEALDADDIARAQSDLQDTDGLSLSQSQSLTRLGTAEEEEERKRKKRKGSRLQDTIIKMMNQAKQDLEHLDEKIRSLEVQYFAQPADTAGLIKGWESGLVGGGGYAANSSKTRKGVPTKGKQLSTQTQAMVTEHIFSLTNSTSATSNALLNRQE